MLSWSTQEAWLILEVVEFTGIIVVTLADVEEEAWVDVVVKEVVLVFRLVVVVTLANDDEGEVVLETWLVVVDKEVAFETIVEDNVVVKDVVDKGRLVLVTVKVDDDREVDTVVTDGMVEVFASAVVILDVLRLVAVVGLVVVDDKVEEVVLVVVGAAVALQFLQESLQ